MAVIQGPWKPKRLRWYHRAHRWGAYIFAGEGLWAWIFASCVLCGLAAAFFAVLVAVGG